MVSKMYAQHAETRILEILWRQTYYGHGISSSEIHRELEIRMGAEAPLERTVRNQLNALEGESFLGRRIGRLTKDEAMDSGCLDPQPGWYLDAFLSAAEVRMLADSLTLSRISHDALEDLVGKLQEVTGDASLGIEYLANVRTVDDYNGQFLSTIERLNQAIEQHNTVKFKYLDSPATDNWSRVRPRTVPNDGIRWTRIRWRSRTANTISSVIVMVTDICVSTTSIGWRMCRLPTSRCNCPVQTDWQGRRRTSRSMWSAICGNVPIRSLIRLSR